MFEHVGFTSDQFKVFDGVIKFIPVDVMNDLEGKQLSSELGFHDGSMFQDKLIPLSGNFVSLRTDRSFSMCSSFPEMWISVSVPSKIMPIAHFTLRNLPLAIETVIHENQYIIDTEIYQEGRLNNRVNCWEPLTGNAEGNQQPSSANGNNVAEKVQRLMGEEPTNNPDTSARRESDDIVWTHWKQ